MIKLKSSILILLTVTSVFLAGCKQNTEMSKDAYISYLASSKSGLVISKNLNGIVYTVKCQTPELICFSENEDNKFTKTEFEQLMKSYDDKIRISLVIEDEGQKSISVKNAVYNKEIYSSIVGYANTELQSDIYILENKKKMKCDLTHLEPANSITPVLRIASAFSNINYKQGFVFVFNDNIFSNGPIKFNFSSDIFNQLPKLKFE